MLRDTSVPQPAPPHVDFSDILGEASPNENAAPLAKGTALNKDLASTEYRENGAKSKRLLTMERLQRDDVPRWFPYAIGGKAPSDKAPLGVPVRIGKEDKYIPARWKDPSKWATFKTAVAAASEIDGKSGVGIMLGLMTNRAICGIDLDSCIEEGQFVPWAKQVLDRLKTYAEISPSGTGAKLFFLIPADNHVALKTLLNEHGKKFEFSKLKHGPAIEIYAEGRFFTVTGNKCSADDTLAVLSVSDIEWLVGHAKSCRKDESFSDVLGDEPAVKSDEAAWIAGIQKCSPKTHDSLLRLATKRAFDDVNKADIIKELRSLLNAVPAELRKRDDGSDRWTARYASVSKIATDAVKFKGKTEAETLERLKDIKFDDLTGEDEDATDITDLGSFDLSENGLIEMFRNNFRAKLRFDFDAGKWFVWNGNRWERNSTQVAHEYARQVSTRVAAVDPKNPAAKSLKRVGTWEAVERGARRVSPLAVTADTWDADAWLLGTPDGTVDLRTGLLCQAKQQDFITKQTAVAPVPLSSFDPARDCPTWLSFLDFATGSDAGAIRFLQQWLGYSLTGDTREQALLFVHGPGGSGKGTAINGFADVMGDYATNVDMSTLTAAKYEGHTTQFARLRGARMARASETEEGKAWAENRIKTLTGGDKVTARFMRQDDFEFVPEFKLTIFGNNRPAIVNVDEAIKRRFNVLPFTHIPAVKDLELGAKLRAEWAGMLSWAILGCLDWQKNGLARPQIVLDATANYFEEQDTFQLWIEAECELGKVHADTTDRLWEAWMNYARDVGEPCGSRNKTFPEMMQRRGYRPIRDTMGIRGRGFAGIRVRESDDLFEDLESNL